MDDITPLNLEDSPKLFGLRYDQLIAILGSLIASTQLYSWLNPVPFLGHDLRLDVSIVLGLIGPAYCLVTLNHSCGHWENIINFYTSSQIFVPGPDPNPTRFLTDEKLPEFEDIMEDAGDQQDFEYSESPLMLARNSSF
ncbi:MAG: hypothetical protein K2Z81_24390 [Cyanobacteria bacterium]|nr:hypothetical protein [Cyanobacteriota bacterium]